MIPPRALSFLAAVPPYPGGKRRLLGAIFGLVGQVQPRSSWTDLSFADPLIGAGSVALTAKALGWKAVHGNDLAERSALVGRALLANSTHKLSSTVTLQLFEPAPAVSAQAPTILDRLDPPVAAFLRNAWGWLQSKEIVGVERDLVALLLVDVLIRCFPMGVPSASDAPHVAAGDFDRLTGPRLGHYLKVGRRLTQPSAVLGRAAAINAAIFPGRATMSNGDAFDFLRSSQADTCYLDPPYGGTQAYERAFALLDEFLGATPLPVSTFSSKSPPLDELLDACRHIPVVVLSLNNALLDEEGLRALVARHRKVERLVSFPYRHYGAVASVRKNAANREFLVLATIDGR